MIWHIHRSSLDFSANVPLEDDLVWALLRLLQTSVIALRLSF